MDTINKDMNLTTCSNWKVLLAKKYSTCDSVVSTVVDKPAKQDLVITCQIVRAYLFETKHAFYKHSNKQKTKKEC